MEALKYFWYVSIYAWTIINLIRIERHQLHLFLFG